jgi:tetratricopeptide (TPR) repeat protein
MAQKESSPKSGIPLAAALEQYQQALERLSDSPQALLPVLLTRDRVETALKEAKPPSVAQVRQLVSLDQRLRREAGRPALVHLSDWRRTLQPPGESWWWHLDEAAKKREAEKDLPWELVTGLFLVLTIPLATDIIRRLWDGSPDTVSVVGTLMTVLLTGSPFTERGRELVQWVFQRIPRLAPRFHAEAQAGLAFLAFVLVLFGRQVALPQLAEQYNSEGLEALASGNMVEAEHNFERAVALDADQSEGYYHMADAFKEIGQTEEAIDWYQKTLQHETDVGPAYNDLGELYIQGGEFKQAVQVLENGLEQVGTETEEELLIRYRLLTNLGWAYFELDETARAREVLRQAIGLESQLAPSLNSDVPEYYLDLVSQPGIEERTVPQWQDSLQTQLEELGE